MAPCSPYSSALLSLTVLLLLPLLLSAQYSLSPSAGCVSRFFESSGDQQFLAYAEPPGPSETDVYSYTATSTGVVDTLYVDVVASGSFTHFTINLYDSSNTLLATSGSVTLTSTTPTSFPVKGGLAHVTQGHVYTLKLTTSGSVTYGFNSGANLAVAGGAQCTFSSSTAAHSVSSSKFSSSRFSSSRFSSSVHSSSVFSSSRFSSSPASSSVSSSRHSSSVFSSSPASSSVSSSRVSSSAVSSSVFSSSLLSSSPVSSSVSSSLFSSSLQSSSPASSSVYSSSAQSSSVYSSSAESSSAQSSSAQSSSTYSSSAVSSSSSSQPPSSTSSASAYSDPRFVGFWGQQWYVEGVVGGVYNLLSDSQVQLNARFVYRSNVTCPVTEDGSPVERCFSEAGTYFGSIALRVTSGEWVTVEGGAVHDGFASVQLHDGTAVHAGQTYRVLNSGGAGSSVASSDGASAAAQPTSSSPPTSLAARLLQRAQQHSRLRGGVGTRGSSDVPSTLTLYTPVLSIHRPDARRLTVSAGAYSFALTNMDGYVDVTRMDTTCWQCVINTLRPDGLLGQTWNATATVRGQSEAEVEEYREARDDTLGCQHAHDRFCRRAASISGTSLAAVGASTLRGRQ